MTSSTRRRSIGSAALLLPALWACGDGRPDGWTAATHGKVPPDYDQVFTTSKVHSIEIKIAASDYEVMQADLAELLGDRGGGGGGGGPGGDLPPELIAACVGLAEHAACSATVMGQPVQGTCRSFQNMLACLPSGGPGGGGGGGGGGGFSTREPIYVPVEIAYDGHTWWHVGMRYKGNSSLLGSGGMGKLPFRLNFDRYESEHPEIDDQRFYGFKELTFSSNWTDDSQLRELFAAELFRDRGVPAARSAFYRVTVDVGAGPIYWGLYTAVEDPADGAMLEAQLGGDGGNLYKPEGAGADWTTFNPEGFVKKSNEEEADWSDVEAAVSALHADQTDAAAWRANLEAVLDAEGFLRWLAVNTAMQNWDSYGRMAHNYYLYAAPVSGGRLLWFPWDLNMSMSGSRGPGGGGGGGPGPTPTEDAVTEMFHASAGTRWPAISRTLADPVYRQRYRELLAEALGGLFETEVAATRMRELHALIAPHVIGEDGEGPEYTTISSADAFMQAIDGTAGLVQHIATRRARVLEALAAP
jgi:spore coat protein H